MATNSSGAVRACVFDAYGTLFDFASRHAAAATCLVIASTGLLPFGAKSSSNIPGFVPHKDGMPISGR